MRLLIIPAVGVLVALAVDPAAAGCQGGNCFEHIVSPPVYETQQHDVLVSSERHVAHRIPAEYSTVEETVMVRGPRQVARHVPAEYAVVNENVLVAPGGRHWQVTVDAEGRTIGCWVDAPPQYAVRQREVVVRPAQTFYETIAGVTATRERTVMTRAAGIHVETIPAEYETVSRQVEVAPARASWQPIGGYGHRHAPRRSCGGLFGGHCRE